MNKTFENKAGAALIIFTILLVFTMVLHPAGGSVEHLIRITPQIMVTHAIAILSLPFGLMGFWGLTRLIGKDQFWTMLAFAAMAIGLIAVMMAASANGLVMPIFLQSYKDASPETIENIKPILRYSFSVNRAFDLIYTGAFCLAILGWSVSIIHTRKLPTWLGWVGILLAVAAVVIFAASIENHSLASFRLFVSSIVLWILLVGVVLTRQRTKPDKQI